MTSSKVLGSIEWSRRVLVGLALAVAACGGHAANPGPDAAAPSPDAAAPSPDAAAPSPDAPPDTGGPATITLVRIEVAPATLALPLGTSRQLVATGVFSDSTTRDLTSQVSWSSDHAALVAVSATGNATAVAKGSATISATMTSITGTAMVTATDALLMSIAVTPPDPHVPLGRTQPLTATGTFSDATTANLTTQVTWSSDAPAIAEVSNATGSNGVVTARAVGPARITAMLGTVSGATTVTVTAAVLMSIAITPPAPRVPVGHTQALTATGTFSDTTTRDLTDQATWASDAPGVATVSDTAGSRGVVAAVAQGDARITAVVNGVTGAATVTVVPVVLISIAVTPPDPRVPLGRTQQLTATGTFDDMTTRDLTNQVVWTSDAPAIADVSNAPGSQGLVTARTLGTARITAATAGVMGATTVTATEALLVTLAVTPPDPHVPAGRTQQLTATGTFSDNTTRELTDQVTWSSDAPAIAEVSNATGSRGLVTARTLGPAHITAVLTGVSGAVTVTVTDAVLVALAVAPSAPQVALGRSQAFIATGTFSDTTTRDLTTQVVWEAADFNVALISNAAGSQGVATTLHTGTTAIRALLQGLTGTATLTVTDAALVSIAVTPANPRVPVNRTLQFTATGTFSDATTQDLTGQVTWTSGDETIATISNAAGSRGVATARSVGPAAIRALLTGVTGSTTMTVTDATLTSIALSPAAPFVAVGLTRQVRAIGTYSDATTLDLTTQVTWASATPGIATISNADGSRGVATGVTVGTVAITAALDSVTGTATLTVTPPELVSIAVAPPTPQIALGRTIQLVVLGTFSDLSVADVTSQAFWSAPDSTIATVSSTGLVTSQSVGSARVFAQLRSFLSMATVTVTPAVVESISVFCNVGERLPVGSSVACTATGSFSDRTTATITDQVTWSSSAPGVATISNASGTRGRVTGVAVGTTTIAAALNGVTGTQLFTVIPAALVSIALSPSPAQVVLGRTVQITATGTFTDGSTRDITNDVTWESRDTTIATVSNLVGARGLVTSVKVGSAFIVASQGGTGGVSNFLTLTVTAPVLTSVTIAPAHPVLLVGGTQAFTATGGFSDGTTRDVSSQVTWASTDPAIAPITSAGVATAAAIGATTISATLGNVTGTTTLTVTAAAIAAIAVTPAGAPAPLGGAQQLTATGTFGDGTVLDVTRQVTWTSANPAAVQVSNAEGTRGVVSGRTMAATTITATLGGVSGSTTVHGTLPYLKASNTEAGDFFSAAIALSADGSTLAVGAGSEDSAATGIDGDQSNNGASSAGAVYVFTRSGASWVQQAYIKASNAGQNDGFGASVALSADGSTLVVGATGEGSAATGINNDQTDNSALSAGAAYVFIRTGTTWTQQAYVKASNTGAGDRFGSAVALSSDGSTLAVGAEDEDSLATGINGDQLNNGASGAGAVYVFVRSAATWTQQAYVKASNTRASTSASFGGAVALSGDGSTLAVGAEFESSAATGINGDQTSTTAASAGAVYVFVRSASTWTQQAYVKASNTGGGDTFGHSVALSSDGTTLAVGAPNESSKARGINGNQSDDSVQSAGAVYVFFRVGAVWAQQAYVKASNTDQTRPDFGGDHFGTGIALSADGSTLAVGAPDEDSAAIGLDGDQTSEAVTQAGAVYLFTRRAAIWTQQSYVKASNTSSSDDFGTTVALSASGVTLAVGALGEGGTGTGVRVDQPPPGDAVSQAGAVYVYR